MDCLYYIRIKFFDHHTMKPVDFEIRESDSGTAIIEAIKMCSKEERENILNVEIDYVGD